ncbi:MAG: hypothetical protein M3Y46_10830 [Actinomycetota bacterium]|nr:hypothetical protein [Actinomycetota bacterium]
MTAEPAHPESAPAEATLARRTSRLPAFLHRFVTPEAVYGLVLYAAVVAAAFDETDDPDSQDATLAWDGASVTISDAAAVLIWVVLSMVVFWGAHVFAHAVAGHGMRNGKAVTVAEATRAAFHHSSGMLYAPILPTLVLLVGALGIIPDDVAIEATLWVSVGVLGVLGFLAFVAKRSSWIISILGGLATAVLGLLIILINAVMH